MICVLRMNISAVFQHDVKGSGVIFVDPEKEFVFRNDVFGDLQGEPEALFSIAFTPAILFNKISNMPRAIPQRFTKAMTDTELPNDFIVLP